MKAAGIVAGIYLMRSSFGYPAAAILPASLSMASFSGWVMPARTFPIALILSPNHPGVASVAVGRPSKRATSASTPVLMVYPENVGTFHN